MYPYFFYHFIVNNNTVFKELNECVWVRRGVHEEAFLKSLFHNTKDNFTDSKVWWDYGCWCHGYPREID